VNRSATGDAAERVLGSARSPIIFRRLPGTVTLHSSRVLAEGGRRRRKAEVE
jgi:hypothetical protein